MKKSHFRYWELVLLLAVAVAFNGVVALRSYDVLRQECRLSNSTQAARFAQVFDEMLQSSDASLLKLEQNHDFIYTVSLERQNKAQDHYRLYCVRTLLNLTLRANQADLFVYYGGSDVIVSAANSTARSDLYYDVYYAGTRQDYWNWKSFINGSTNSKVGTVYYDGQPCLAIARTLLKDNSILIFDDSLSAVDTETDAQIRAALSSEQKDVTTLIISHRVTTLSQADMILVLEDGRITQQGTHAELCRQPGLYQRINSIQTALEEELNDAIASEANAPAGTERK